MFVPIHIPHTQIFRCSTCSIVCRDWAWGWKAPVHVKRQYCLTYRWGAQSISKLSRAPFPLMRRNLYGPKDPVTHSKATRCVLFRIGTFLSRNCLEVVLSGMLEKASIRSVRYNKEPVQYNLKSIKFCSELERENFSQILQKETLLKNEVRTEERGSASDIDLYRKMLEVLRKQSGMCPTEKRMQFRALQNKQLLNPRDTSFFKNPGGWVRQGVLQTFAYGVSWDGDAPDLSTLLV